MATSRGTSLAQIIENSFFWQSGYSRAETFMNGRTFSGNDIFNRYIEVRFDQETIEFPSLFANLAVAYAHKYKTIADAKTGIYFNLYHNGNVRLLRTTASILRNLFQAGVDERIVRINTNGGEVIYGNQSMIFNGNMELLLYIACKMKSIDTNPRANFEKAEATCYIHPRVFTGPKTIITKAIVNDVMPAVLNMNCFDNKKVSVKIEEIDHFIKTPVKPMADFDNEKLNDLLVENIDEVTCDL